MAERRLINLDPVTRRWMLEELRWDLERDNVSISPFLTERGRREYAEILAEAMEHHDETWLANALGSNERMDLTQRSGHEAGAWSEEVPVTEPQVLAEGEFNRYYARGLCRRAMDEGIEELSIYKYTPAANPHFVYELPEVGNEPTLGVEAGTSVDPAELLERLRASPEAELDTGLPGMPHSGLNVRLPG